MKSYNSCDDPRHPSVAKLVEHEPVKSLLTGLKKISPSASAAFLVGVLETVVGLILLFPLVLGIIYTHWGLIVFGGYGVLLITFGLIGAVGVERQRHGLVQLFFFWKIFSVVLVGAIVAGVILMVLFDVMPEISSTWFSIVVIAVLGVVFVLWAIGGMIWVHPLWSEMRELPLTVHEETDMAMLSGKEDVVPASPAPPGPEVGKVPADDPYRMAVRLFNKSPESMGHLKK